MARPVPHAGGEVSYNLSLTLGLGSVLIDEWSCAEFSVECPPATRGFVMAVLLHEQTPDYVTGTLRVGSKTVMQACPAREFRPGQFSKAPRLKPGDQIALTLRLLRPTTKTGVDQAADVPLVICTPTVRLLVYGVGDWKPSCRLESVQPEPTGARLCCICNAPAVGSWRCVDRTGSLYDIYVCGRCQPTESADIDMKIDGTFRSVGAAAGGLFGGR